MERGHARYERAAQALEEPDRRAITEELLRRARAGEFELAVTRVIEADVPHDVHFSAGARGGTPADPPQFVTAVPNQAPGQTFLLHPGRVMRILAIEAADEEEPPHATLDGRARDVTRRQRRLALDVAALAVALFALGFTIASFWWLHARAGSLEAATPRTYAFTNKVRLRLPLAFFNTGAKSLIVNDLRIALGDEPERSPFEWITTRTALRPDADDGFAFATPFAVAGRSSKQVIVEFGDDNGWSPSPASKHRLRLQAVIHPATDWVDVLTFDWWAPPAEELMGPYVAHRNKSA